jgi:hypothetical protein
MWTLKPLEAADLSLLGRWLNQPHVARWWGGSIDMAAVLAKYLPRIADPAAVAGYVALYRYDPVANAAYIPAFRHQKDAGY